MQGTRENFEILLFINKAVRYSLDFIIELQKKFFTSKFSY